MVINRHGTFFVAVYYESGYRQINTVAYEPYKNGEITQQEAVSRMADPLKQFMLRNTEKDYAGSFCTDVKTGS